MSILLHAHALAHSAGRRPLFDGLDLAISVGDRLGLVGHNGSGKSTLLDILAGAREADSGHISRGRNLRLARVEQFMPPALARLSLLETVADACPADEMWRAAALLEQLGFPEHRQGQRASELSGGQLNRLMLARALVQQPQLLLLDEPTNHLDLATLSVFERSLQDFRGAILLVSHDRAFLDQVTTTTLVLRDHRIYRFELPYSRARVELEQMDAAAAHRHAVEEKKISSLRTSAKRMADWGRTYDNEDLARRAKSMFRRVERMEEDRTFVTKGSPLDLELSVAGGRGNRVITLENLTVGYGEGAEATVLFRIDECYLRPGERVALLGHNGVGKTTLIRYLVSAFAESSLPDERLRINPQTRLGYYDQELQEAAGDVSLFDFVANEIAREDQGIVQTLIAAGFAFEAHQTPMASLSGGERARALFARLSLLRPNFLILDEPTNHIDIEGREQLEAQLLGSDAAVLFTSHDREFVRGVAQRFLVIEDNGLVEVMDPEAFFAGSIDAGVVQQDTPANLGGTDNQERAVELAEDELLERIEFLEQKLADDEARKPKFQKPQRQSEWRAELQLLLSRLE